MNVTVAPNPSAPSTSMEVSWSFDAEDPQPVWVQIIEYDSNDNYVDSSGQLTPTQSSFTFLRLNPNTTYYYMWCEDYLTDAGEDSNCSSWNAYSGTTKASSPPPPPTQPVTVQITGVQTFPKGLYFDGDQWVSRDNGFNLSWASTGNVGGIDVRLESESGAPISGLNYGGVGAEGTSGTVLDFTVPAPGTTYLVKVSGELPSTDFSPAYRFVSAKNFSSMRGFLRASGVSGNNGIQQFFPKGSPVSLKTVMGV
jgi:hypothetical protein